jgi:hypothetical protein
MGLVPILSKAPYPASLRSIQRCSTFPRHELFCCSSFRRSSRCRSNVFSCGNRLVLGPGLAVIFPLLRLHRLQENMAPDFCLPLFQPYDKFFSCVVFRRHVCLSWPASSGTGPKVFSNRKNCQFSHKIPSAKEVLSLASHGWPIGSVGVRDQAWPQVKTMADISSLFVL